MSLSGFFRDYLYIPLGGNRGGFIKTLRNIFVVWLLTGFWHGASWNFILWGLYYFTLLVIEKLFLHKLLNHLPSVLQHIYALFWIVIGWVIFACDDLTMLKSYFQMLIGVGIPACNQLALYEWTTHSLFLVILALSSTQFMKKACDNILQKISSNIGEAVAFWLKSSWCLLVLLLSISMLVSGSYNPFLYFRF